MTIDEALGVALEAIYQTIEYENEWGAKDYEPHEIEAKMADLHEAARVLEAWPDPPDKRPPIERCLPEYRTDEYRHFYTLGNRPAIIHVQPYYDGGYWATVEFDDGLKRPLEDAHGSALRWTAPGRALDLWQADLYQGVDGIDTAIRRAEVKVYGGVV
jgi:hypothetical protein